MHPCTPSRSLPLLVAPLLGSALFLASGARTTLGAQATAASPRTSMVTVRITGQDWNVQTPWSKTVPWSRSVTGLVVEGRRILVAGGGFGNHVLVEVEKGGVERRTPAQVILHDPEGPLTLLGVEDEAFWQDLAPLPLAEEIPVEGEVTIHRWGGTGRIESARGEIRQVRGTRHGAARTTLLSLEIGSPMEGVGASEIVVSQSEVVALATAKSSETILALGSPVLSQFLADASRDPYPGIARAGLHWQDLTNRALRQALGLSEADGGIRLTRVLPHGSGGGVLQKGDVLLSVAGRRVDATGQIEHPVYGRMLFAVAFAHGVRPGEAFPVRVLRDGARMDLDLTLRRMAPEADRVPPYVLGRGPDFVVVGGLVFQELSGAYLAAGDSRRAPLRLQIENDKVGQESASEGGRIVFLSSVLPDTANLGYQELRELLLSRVGGLEVRSLEDLRKALATPHGAFHIFDFVPGQGTERVVLDAAEAEASDHRVRQLYDVVAQ